MGDLFTPTITAQPTTGKPPWDGRMLAIPAILGGPLAATVLGLINGRRLGVGAGAQAAVLVAGVVAFALRLTAVAVIGGSDGGGRISSALAGAATYGVMRLFQRRPERAFDLRGGKNARLLWPGIAATLGAVLVDTVCAVAILQGVDR